MAQRRKYSEEFKREAVGLIRQPRSERSAQIAKELGVQSPMSCCSDGDARWMSSGKKAFHWG